MEHQMQSLADQVFEVLERDILNGSYSRGEALTEARLCENLRVSRTPVREAVKRLEQEHLLEVTSKGMVVKGLSREDIADIYEIRYRLEGLSARRLAERATPEDLEKMRETLDLQEFYTLRNDSESIKNMDSQFHRDIYLFCGSNALRYTLDGLIMRIVKYRKASVSHSGRAPKSLEEHRAIYAAIAAHDGDTAERLMQAHVRAAYEALKKSGQDDS